MVKKETLQIEVIVLAIVAVVGLITMFVAPNGDLVGHAKELRVKESTQTVYGELELAAKELESASKEYQLVSYEQLDADAKTEAEALEEFSSVVYKTEQESYTQELRETTRKIKGHSPTISATAVRYEQNLFELRDGKIKDSEIKELTKFVKSLTKAVNKETNERRKKYPQCVNPTPSDSKDLVSCKGPCAESDACNALNKFQRESEDLNADQVEALERLEKRYFNVIKYLRRLYQEVGISLPEYKESIAEKTPVAYEILANLAQEAKEQDLTHEEVVKRGELEFIAQIVPALDQKLDCGDIFAPNIGN
jgi:hypothetical protein